MIVVAENCMKHAIIHPEEDRYDFGPADEFVKFGEDKWNVYYRTLPYLAFATCTVVLRRQGW